MKHTHDKHIGFSFWPMPECRQMSKVITASLDGTLSWRERILMKIHLLACDPCANFLKQITYIQTAISHNKHVLNDESISLGRDARSRIKQALETARPL